MRYYPRESIAFVTQGNERVLKQASKVLKILQLCKNA